MAYSIYVQCSNGVLTAISSGGFCFAARFLVNSDELIAYSFFSFAPPFSLAFPLNCSETGITNSKLQLN